VEICPASHMPRKMRKHMLVMLLMLGLAGCMLGSLSCQAVMIGEQQVLEIEAGDVSNRARLRHSMQVKTRNLGSSEEGPKSRCGVVDLLHGFILKYPWNLRQPLLEAVTTAAPILFLAYRSCKTTNQTVLRSST
jgi:hypothetical protein